MCVLMCALMLCPTGCRQQASSDAGKQTREELDSLRQSFRYFNVEGQYDSIISTARPILMKALDGQDTMTVLLTGAYTAQAFLTMESMDSVRHYMNLIGPYSLTHLKAELNYSLALESFTEGCKWAEAGNDPDNHIVLLANIAHIFYVRGDRHGLQYAEEAYAIARDQAVEDFPRCQAHLLMAQMLLLADRTQEAAAYLNDARTMIEEHQFTSLISICRLLYANMYQSKGDYFQAERNYQEAMRWGKYAEAGTATLPFEQLTVGSKHYIFAIGIAADGTVLSNAVLEPFTTDSIELLDITFNVSCDVDGPNATLHTIPSDNGIRYYTDVKLKSDWPNGPDLQGWIQTLIWRGSVNGETAEQVVDELSSFGEVTKEYYLNANTDYYAYAVAINEEGILASEAEIIEFTTGNVHLSENTFKIELEIGVDNVDMHVIPSNNDQYAWAVSPAAEWEGLTDEEYVEEYISDYAGFLDIYAKRGETTVSQGSLLSNTEYYAFVFGFEQYTRTTGITKVKFTTRQAGNPEDLAFTFTTSNATAGSVDVRIEGTPDNALYYWDIVAASATQEETSEILEARIQRWLDKGVYTDRVTVFQKRGSRGIVETTATTHDSGYALIEPGKEYKLYAVGIYEETGEYATDFVFSEPFTTPVN